MMVLLLLLQLPFLKRRELGSLTRRERWLLQLWLRPKLCRLVNGCEVACVLTMSWVECWGGVWEVLG